MKSNLDVSVVIERLRHEVRHVAWPGETLEQGEWVTRRRGELSQVAAFGLDADSADLAIQAELTFFASLGQGFEWKVFSTDPPPDLLERLANHGFVIGDPEAVMVLGLDVHLDDVPDVRVELVDSEARLDQFQRVAETVFTKDYAFTTGQLRAALAEADDHHRGYVAYLNGEPAGVGRLYTLPTSHFGGLYGGGTLPAVRGLGVYRALVARRAADARARGARYALVDALPTSRPILERLGFVRVADTWPCDSPEK